MKTLLSADVNKAVTLLQGGSLVAIPTETVYGMAANGFSEDAVRAIFKVKNRPFYDPLILHTDSIPKIEGWGMQFPPKLRALCDAFWPGPLTVLLQRSDRISDLITAGLPRVAFRVPAFAMTRDVLSRLDFPLAAPSANPFGSVSPTHHNQVMAYFDGHIPMVLEGGACPLGIESTIVGMEDEDVVVYRLGSLALEQIEGLVGKVRIQQSSSRPQAPGMLQRHYAPAKKVLAIDSAEELNQLDSASTAFVLFHLQPPINATHVVHLSHSGSDEEAAAGFYMALSRWDEVQEVTTIAVERMPEFGLGRAINDRLQRAAATFSF